MKQRKYFFWFLFFILGSALLYAQDTIFRLGPDQISESGYLRFPPITEWKFKEGNDPNWAKPDYDDSQWIQMDSTQVMDLWYDDNHLFEGWFRFKFQLEPGFENVPGFVFSNNGAATDLYLDGQRAARFGVVGTTPETFRRNRFYPEYLPLQKGRVYTAAVHMVDRVGPASQFLNKRLIVLGTNSFLYLVTKPAANKRMDTVRERTDTLRLIGGAMLAICLLVWLFWALNRKHKHLLYLAILSTSITFLRLSLILYYEQYPRSGIWFNEEFFAFKLIIGSIGGAIIGVFIPWLLASLLTGKIPKWLKITGMFALFVLCPCFIVFNAEAWTQIIPVFVIVAGTILGLYYLIRYRNHIRGARWVLVIGLALTAVAQAIVSFFPAIVSFFDTSLPLDLIIIIIPLSFAIYVALWLRETQLSERKKALEVARVSRENQHILREQNRTLDAEVQKRTRELRSSLNDLKETQKQLIHAEKMASLGELTAGIAHEIKNPLNFINNFSELNAELLAELEEEISKGNLKEVKQLARDIAENEQKITHHGQRADSIVRGMLQHSRSGDGKKEPTDLNALADEYLRLAYHGLRAKDKSFNATMETDFDPSLPKVEVIPQDIGRVILNLLTNAFHAVSERKKKVPEGYDPTVWVQTRKTDAGVEISVRDNGGGIPEEIREKIFQPFFTTKPTGEGTGLGLSMSYDIVTKGHGGQLKATSEEGKGTTFTVWLPN